MMNKYLQYRFSTSQNFVLVCYIEHIQVIIERKWNLLEYFSCHRSGCQAKLLFKHNKYQLRSISVPKILKFQPLPFAWPCARFLGTKILQIQSQSQAQRMKIAEVLRSSFEPEHFELVTSYWIDRRIDCAILIDLFFPFFLWLEILLWKRFCPKILRSSNRFEINISFLYFCSKWIWNLKLCKTLQNWMQKLEFQ